MGGFPLYIINWHEKGDCGIIMAMVTELIRSFFGDGVAIAFHYIFIFYPVWLPIILGIVFLEVWLRYIRTKFIAAQGKILLELRIPREVLKSPRAMEIFYTSLYQTGSATYIESFYKGKVRPWFSLELVSFGGEIHFYIWAWKKWRNHIEAQLYAQYPDLEIYEAEDYSLKLKHSPDTPFWATYFRYTKPNAYPIKTYIDYGLDDDPDEEVKIDPMTSTLEFMGSLKPGEQVWLQILMQAHRKESIKDDAKLFPKGSWKDAAVEEKKKLVKKYREDSRIEDDEGKKSPPIPLTKGEGDIIAAVERSLHKTAFDVVIRGFYIAPKEIFNDHLGISGLIGSFRQYSSDELNGFKLGKFTDYDYPWQDFNRIRRNKLERGMLEAYKRRAYFQHPYKYFMRKDSTEPMVMTTEELATIFHIPGQVAQTPGLARIPSKKSQAPINLPI